MKRVLRRATGAPDKPSPYRGATKRGRAVPEEVGLDELLEAAAEAAPAIRFSPYAVVLTEPPACHQPRAYGCWLPDGPFWRFLDRTVGDPAQLWRTAVFLAVVTASLIAILLTASVAVRVTGAGLGVAAVLIECARMASQRRGTAQS